MSNGELTVSSGTQEAGDMYDGRDTEKHMEIAEREREKNTVFIFPSKKKIEYSWVKNLVRLNSMLKPHHSLGVVYPANGVRLIIN